MKAKSLVLVLAWLLSGCSAIERPKVIQIDISPLLNTRPVTTLTQGKLINWTKGIDGNGLSDGYLTRSAALFKGDGGDHALPDTALFTANAKHPDILLHYDNGDSTHQQARYVSGAGEFLIAIPQDKYTHLYLGFTSSEGASSLAVELRYTDGKTAARYQLPDYYDDIAEGDAQLSYVATDLAKWDRNNQLAEADHHNIDLLKLAIDPSRELTAIKVSKSKEGYLVFWSATAVRN